MGDLTGRVAIITGASSGIGLAAAEEMARRGAHVVLVGRDRARLTAAEVRVRGVATGRAPVAFRADFSRLDEVHTLVDEIRQRYGKVDVLANNAGGMIRKRTITQDGFEATIQTNHLAPFLLSSLLREQLRGGRIIATASAAHWSGRINPADLAGARRYWAWRAYCAAKLANVLFAREAAIRWPDILSASFHPGVVRTRFAAGTLLAPFFRIAPMLNTPEQGADTLVWLAANPPAHLTSGGYYTARTLTKPSAAAADTTLAAQLWDASTTAVFT